MDKASDEMPEAKHIDSLCNKIYEYGENGSIKTSMSLPGKTRAVLEKGTLTFTRDTREKENHVAFCIKLSEGLNFIDGTDFAVDISFCKKDIISQTITHKGENIYKKYTTDYLYSDTISDSLFARSRSDGGKILSGGMNKSIKQLMSKNKIPVCDRYLLPLIYDGNTPVLIPGAAKCDLYGNSKASGCITVTVYRKNN